MKITSKGQVTIPKPIRERYGFLPGTEIEFVEEDGGVRIRKAEGDGRRGRRIVDRMRGRATTGMTTDEILELTRGDG